MVTPILVDLNHVELKYYPFIVGLINCSRSFNSGNDLSTKISVPSKTKDINIKTFINNDKWSLVQYFVCDSKCKFDSATCNANQKWYKKTCQSQCKNYRKCKTDYNYNPSSCICKSTKSALK